MRSDAVLSTIEGMRDEATALLSGLIRTQSVNPEYPGVNYDQTVGGEHDVTQLLARFARAEGWTEVDTFAKQAGRTNLVVRIAGDSSGVPSLMLNGHVDVVPPGPDTTWTYNDPFSGTVRDGAVWGRGAVDQKGGLAAQFIAAAAIRRTGLTIPGDLLLAAVVGEEMGRHDLGTSAVLERGYRPGSAIVTEPTVASVPQLCPTTAGTLWWSITTVGKSVHSSQRGRTIYQSDGQRIGVNAIDQMIEVVHALRRLERRWAQTCRHPLFPAGHMAISLGVIRGGATASETPYIVPDRCTAEFSTFYLPHLDPTEIRAEVEAAVSDASVHNPWLREHPPEFTWRWNWPPPPLPAPTSLVESIQKAAAAAGLETLRVSGFDAVCDTTWLAQAGVPSVVAGPGSLALAHMPDERVRIEEVLGFAAIYALAALNGPQGPLSHPASSHGVESR